MISLAWPVVGEAIQIPKMKMPKFEAINPKICGIDRDGVWGWEASFIMRNWPTGAFGAP